MAAINAKIMSSRLMRNIFQILCGLLSIFYKYFPQINFLQMLIWSSFISMVRLVQSVERGANNAKVMSSRLIRRRFHFLCGLLSIFK